MSTFPKLGRALDAAILTRVKAHGGIARLLAGKTGSETVFYHSGGRYFRKCIREQISPEYKQLDLRNGAGTAVISMLSSSLYYWLWIAISDCYHVTKRDVEAAPIPDSFLEDDSHKHLATMLLADLHRHSVKRIRRRADGSQREEINFYVGESKPILDEIDTVLAGHYGFTEEELDFIVNYDIKYRLGRGAGDAEEA